MKRIIAYQAAAFLGAFLLFQIQPMVSRMILPFMGGSFMVWGACMAFFQFMLLAGYLYVHLVHKGLSVRRYARVHPILMLLPLATIPVCRATLVSPPAAGNLALDVFLTLLVSVGAPTLVLATTSLVVQKWLADSSLPERENPYVLYAASNLGSILGLLSYPTVSEPLLGLRAQLDAWWIGYALFVALMLACLPRGEYAASGENRVERGTASFRDKAGWFGLSAAACAILLAVTNMITMDIASVPLLWVLPLAVYLFCFVLAFKRRLWFPAFVSKSLSWVVLTGMLLFIMSQLLISAPWYVLVAVQIVILFVVCMNCAGWLVTAKPVNSADLTAFYVMIAVGGLAGTLLVSWIMPLVSARLLEFPASLVAAYAACRLAGAGRAAAGMSQDPQAPKAVNLVTLIELVSWIILLVVVLAVLPDRLRGLLRENPERMNITFAVIALPVALAARRMDTRPLYAVIIFSVVTAAACWTEEAARRMAKVHRIRNFYGIYQVYDRAGLRYLKHGTTQHGKEYVEGEQIGVPLSYYHKTTPIGQLMSSGEFSLSRVGMIGLGTGALSSYMGKGQSLRVFELDPDSLKVADKYFTFLAAARARGAALGFSVGDGRVSLRREPVGVYDMLIVDAFNSDSIPMHLFTVEAFEEYLRVLKPDGVLVLHVSNRILDLGPVAYSNARRLGVPICNKDNPAPRPPEADPCDWIALSREQAVVDKLIRDFAWTARTAKRKNLPKPWTDQYSNIFSAIDY